MRTQHPLAVPEPQSVATLRPPLGQGGSGRVGWLDPAPLPRRDEPGFVPAADLVVDVSPAAPGERLRRLERRRRLVREELLAVVVLVLFLATAVAVLATQWLDSGSSSGTAPAAAAFSTYPGGTT